ncbi:hypothetical protein Syun_027179 [Stephania yunnanensis]|uniref:HMA domain-containing protein n=1 Tax=Stephania yunnanensis TaxID=152371 RepID=A0AAP0EKM2_9MAGN
MVTTRPMQRPMNMMNMPRMPPGVASFNLASQANMAGGMHIPMQRGPGMPPHQQQQSCVLKVNIHCDGCKQDAKKLLQRIEGGSYALLPNFLFLAAVNEAHCVEESFGADLFGATRLFWLIVTPFRTSCPLRFDGLSADCTYCD